MTPIDYLIIVLFIIIVSFKYLDDTKEHYTTLWTPFSRSSPNLVNTQCTALSSSSTTNQTGPNNRRLPKNFGNFGIIGKYPSIPICDSCGLEFDCVGYEYDNVDDKNMNVCRKCKKDSLDKNYNELDKSLYVYARSVGRPRQCRMIN